MYDMEQSQETVILTGIDTGDGEAARRSLDELEELAKTAGGKSSRQAYTGAGGGTPGDLCGQGKTHGAERADMGDRCRWHYL